MIQPLISVIIPVFNAERFIAEAIQSVVDQGIEAIEIICVDDGSTDRSAEIVQSYGPRVRYHWQENGGPAAARNKAFEFVRGQFVAFLDSDDLFPQDKLTRQLAIFEVDPELEVVSGKAHYVFLDGSNPERFRFPDDSQKFWNILLGAGLFRTEVFRRIGLFNEELKSGEDLDWFNRAKEQGVRMRITADVTLLYRHHSQNHTRDQHLVKSEILKVIKYSLDRRRSEAGVCTLPTFSDFQQTNTTETT